MKGAQHTQTEHNISHSTAHSLQLRSGNVLLALGRAVTKRGKKPSPAKLARDIARGERCAQRYRSHKSESLEVLSLGSASPGVLGDPLSPPKDPPSQAPYLQEHGDSFSDQQSLEALSLGSDSPRVPGGSPSPPRDPPSQARNSDFTVGYAKALDAVVMGPGGVLCDAAALCLESSRCTSNERQRDIFPLPLLISWPADVALCSQSAESACVVANACLLSLNLLWADFKVARLSRPLRCYPTAGQADVQRHVAQQTAHMLLRLAEHRLHWKGAFEHFEKTCQPQYEPLKGDAVDLPDKAATCDPLPNLPEDLRAAVTNPDHIFPDGLQLVPEMRYRSAEDKAEYIKLVVREVECGKLRFRKTVFGVASVFGAAKSMPGRQRKIWNGSELSAAAAPPPCPERLANPSSFLDIDAGSDEVVYYSKRDAATYFDVLQAPTVLQAMARTAQSHSEGAHVGLQLDTRCHYCLD